jgi:hypothetical protein
VSVGVDVTEGVCVEEAVAVRVLTLESVGYVDALITADDVGYVEALISVEGVGYVDALISVEGVGYIEAVISVEAVGYIELLMDGTGVIDASGDVVTVINVVIDAT